MNPRGGGLNNNVNVEDEEPSLKEIKLAKILIDRPPPHCSAQSWVVYDRDTHYALFGRMEKERREVASLTKIMTFYTVL